MYVVTNLPPQPDMWTVWTSHACQCVLFNRSGKGSPKYDCVAPECDKSFRLLASLKSHIYRMGRNHNPAEKKYSCDDCGSLFQSIVAKRKHHR